MPYLGNPPAERFTSLSKQTITGDGGTAYTLDFPVGSDQDVEVFVNNVRQEPSVAYTVSGTSLTMTGAVQSSDDFYVVFQGKAIGTISHPAANALQATTGTFSGAITSGGNSVLTSASALDTEQVTADTVAFRATASGGQTITSSTTTVVQYATEDFDTHNYYDTSTYRFTPQIAGYYYLQAQFRINTDGDFEIADIDLRKNASMVARFTVPNTRYNTYVVSGLVYMNGSTDYADVIAYLGATQSLRTTANENAFFGYLVRAD